MNRTDHLVVAAETLEQGVDYIRDRLGVEIPKGGMHDSMATHNHVMRIGDEIYLELIAINPGTPAPGHPRWFSLDDSLMRESLSRQPRLITWAINSDNLDELNRNVRLSTGTPTELSRDQLRWRINLPGDGRLLANGMLPYSIQWLSKPHPARAMADLGCRLQSLVIHHNRPDWLAVQLEAMGADQLVDIQALSGDEPAYLTASIATPSGVKILTSRPPA